MKIDLATLAFGYSLEVGGGTPNWATSLGQSREREYRINDDPGIMELIKGITYKAVPLSRVSSKIGKGGSLSQGNDLESPIIIAGLFEKVFINNTFIKNGKFLILVTRDNSQSHYGRLRFKYGPSNTYSCDNAVNYSNEMFWEIVKRQLNLSHDACFFVYDISVKNQDELRLKTIFVNKNGSQSYHNSDALHAAWKKLIAENDEEYGYDDALPKSYYDSFSHICEQTIYYGVPGSGKSNMIEEITSNTVKMNFQKKRVVFHPDYTNADFIGQIIPQKEGQNISYKFKDGPFTAILKDACNPAYTAMPFYLIIEEINRGNAASIFGDVFQLLDRAEDGWSKYYITNEEICRSVYGDDIASQMSYMVKLPPNLSILATMNTSDQNVFALDNAFQRRWNMVHVRNKFQTDSASDVQRKAVIEGTSMTWEQFLFGSPDGTFKGINKIISDYLNNTGMSSIEDKRIGCWFVENRDGKITKDDFSNKVLKYLWDDAFHFDKGVFYPEITSFEDLLDSFDNRKQLFVDLPILYE